MRPVIKSAASHLEAVHSLPSRFRDCTLDPILFVAQLYPSRRTLRGQEKCMLRSVNRTYSNNLSCNIDRKCILQLPT